MRGPRRRKTALTLVFVIFLGLGSACLPPLNAFRKAPGAVDPKAPLGGYDTVSQCPSFLGVSPPSPGYQGEVEPLVQRSCLACHAPGGPGTAKLTLTRGDPQDNNTAASNFVALLVEANPEGGGVDINDPDGTSPILQRLNGGLTHSLTLDIGGDDYGAIRDWVTQELSKACAIDPTTGVVTVASAPAK